MDGGTVNHIKWLAVGFLFRTNEDIIFQILDMFVFEKATAKNIKSEVEKISTKIKSEYKGKIVECCTDNAANFTKVFLDPGGKVTNFVLLDIIRVSYACHTIQLVLKDLKKEDGNY